MQLRPAGVSESEGDSESADGQLRAEAQASQTVAQLGDHTAERSASLLNAARAAKPVTNSGSSPRGHAPATQLNRPSFQRANLARLGATGLKSQTNGRRKDPYEPSPSPEKKDRRKANVQTSTQLRQVGKNEVKRKSSRLAGKAVDLSAQQWEKRPEHTGKSKAYRRKRGATQESVHASLRPRKSSKRGSDPEPTVAQPETTTSPVQPQGSRSPQVVIRSSPSVSETRADGPKERLAMAKADEASSQEPSVGGEEKPATPDSRPARSPDLRDLGQQKSRPAESIIACHDPPANVQGPPAHFNGGGDEHLNSDYMQSSIEDSDLRGETDAVPPTGHLRSGAHESLDDASDDEKAAPEGTEEDEATIKIHAFIEKYREEGICNTKHGERIQRYCAKAKEIVLQHQLPLEELTEHCEGVGIVLRSVHRQRSTEQKAAFQEDAFACLFVSLASFFDAVYDCLTRRRSAPAVSISTHHTITSLIEQILTFYETLASWRIKRRQKYAGDCTVRDVRRILIAPFRKLLRQHQVEVERLERADTLRKAKEADRAKWEERERRVREAVRLQERRERWRELHIIRLCCDNGRRKDDHLTYHDPFKDNLEVDANGVQFQREAIFRERAISFSHPPSDQVQWGSEQEEALIAGLLKYAGDHVFEEIFRQYCKPGGLLEDFNVTQITSKAALVKNFMIDLYRGRRSDVPKWVTAIPVLP